MSVINEGTYAYLKRTCPYLGEGKEKEPIVVTKEDRANDTKAWTEFLQEYNAILVLNPD